MPMKRLFAIILTLALLCCAVLPISANASGTVEGWYVVNSTSPYGYCYLYSNPSDRDGYSTNLGRYDNGTVVYVWDYYGGKDGKFNYCFVQTQDGKQGYMHDYALNEWYGNIWTDYEPGWYVIESQDPYGYCYLYSAASDQAEYSWNKGRHENGELVYVLDYYGGQEGKFNYCHVRTMDGETGYMHDYALKRYYGDPRGEANAEGWYVIQSQSPYGYCYLYSAASDRDEYSRNMGRHKNGEVVYVLDFYGGQDGKYNYCRVRTMDGEIGYMHDYALMHYLTYIETQYGSY